MVNRSLIVSTVALMTLSVAIGISCAQAPDVKVQGPWAYTRQTTGAAEAVQDMATTTASEDDNVWLLVACSQDRQATVAIMDVRAFPYPVERRAKVALRIDAHPRLTVLGLAINDRQISIEPTSSHALLPLLLDGHRSSVTIADSRGDTHDYSFVLQPNDLALGSIRANCLDLSQQQE